MQRFPMRLIAIPFFAASLALSSVARADTAKVYQTNCTLCHAADGSGSSSTGKALHAKDLRSDEVQKQADAVLSEVITKGKGKMPAFGAKLSADSVKELVAYIRALPSKK